MKIDDFDGASLEGAVYFIVMFNDPGMGAPLMQTLRYVGRKNALGQGDVALFKELNIKDQPLFFVRSEDVAHTVLDRVGLISILERSFSGD